MWTVTSKCREFLKLRLQLCSQGSGSFIIAGVYIVHSLLKPLCHILVYLGSTQYLHIDWRILIILEAILKQITTVFLAVFINYDVDRQKKHVRNTRGNCEIWGTRPQLIHATYLTSEGEEKKSFLLASGWWGVSRHFHYIPELLAAFCWTIPALFHSALPYFYFVFLFLLLTHRAVRDDWRCLEKYGQYWKLYCSKVPYRIFPLLF